MANYDFQNDFQNDAARKNYDAAMDGKARKGVDFFEKPLTWEEENPVHPTLDTPTMNIVPIPTPSSSRFADYSPLKKVLVIVGIVAAAAAILLLGISFFRDGGFNFYGFSNSFW